MKQPPIQLTRDVELAPAYWRLLVSRVPQIAADRLARDIHASRFSHDRLLARANDLRDHVRARVRARAVAELLPALECYTAKSNVGATRTSHWR